MPRDLDADLRTAITAADRNGGFVLLVGGSSMGNTRALFEAVRAAAVRERQRAEGLAADLRTQLDGAHRRLAQTAWPVRYPPRPLRQMVLHGDASEGRHPYPRPDDAFVETPPRPPTRPTWHRTGNGPPPLLT